MWAVLDCYADFFAANFCAFAAPAAAAATAWPRPRSCESNATAARVGAGVTAVAASRPKMNETVAAAAKMLLALLDLDCLDLMRGAASSGIVLSVLVMMSVAVNMIVAEESGDCVEFMLLAPCEFQLKLDISHEKNARGTYLHT